MQTWNPLLAKNYRIQFHSMSTKNFACPYWIASRRFKKWHLAGTVQSILKACNDPKQKNRNGIQNIIAYAEYVPPESRLKEVMSVNPNKNVQ